MAKWARAHKYLPAVWMGLAVGILVGDYLAGPFVAFTVLFIIPVALAARFSGGRLGMTLGALLPIAHLGFSFLWPVPWTLGDSVLNAALRAGVLASFAFLISHVTRQSREIRALRELLPICGFCKKIRTEAEQWVPIEHYISERSEVSFTHGFCPDCIRQHFPEYCDKLAARQAELTQTSPENSVDK